MICFLLFECKKEIFFLETCSTKKKNNNVELYRKAKQLKWKFPMRNANVDQKLVILRKYYQCECLALDGGMTLKI